MNEYEENQKRLIEEMKKSQSYEGRDVFDTYYQRREEFERFFLDGPDSIPNCGCGDPDKTLQAVLDALDYCASTDWDWRSEFLEEKFGVKYVSDSGLVQLLFYVLDDRDFISHGGTVNGSWLSDAGKVFHVLLKQHLNEMDYEQILNREFDIDFDALLASN